MAAERGICWSTGPCVTGGRRRSTCRRRSCGRIITDDEHYRVCGRVLLSAQLLLAGVPVVRDVVSVPGQSGLRSASALALQAMREGMVMRSYTFTEEERRELVEALL